MKFKKDSALFFDVIKLKIPAELNSFSIFSNKPRSLMLLIEGLVSGRSIHASAVYIFDNGYIELMNEEVPMTQAEYDETLATTEDILGINL